ncbi:FAD-binding, type 2 [Cordyceps fumosorosea ARSEF 2679]|uniref:FAD-binding, type 2 n=1 Tax=Cordyceps fumosorosea (strain ARSEF 2679) TaxID=1081104 RepID=A0A167ZLA9_CORFA|nr:FAD-binding, type 2 [Cordyceps fumosorosea ARSEF 2679]OAA67650.1 FAD-binding, type 2 [Cordyceps fumosorosea ARSEF 2679]
MSASASDFQGRVHIKSNDPGFTVWDQKQAEAVYACRVQPKNAKEVSSIIKILVRTRCKFAVKGGGHARFPNDSVSVGGVTVDLGLLNRTEVAADRSTARIGGGSLSHEAFTALEPYGLAFVGGRVGQVGVGGFTLGGGSSVFASKYGWALDNVLGYEIVLANATIVQVTYESHPDLYFAVRGGGNNFGIVTSFNVSVFPLGAVYTGSRRFGESQNSRVLAAAEEIFRVQDTQDPNVVLEYRYTYSSQDGWGLETTQRYGQALSRPPVYDALNSIPAQGHLVGGISSLADNTQLSESLGTTRYDRVPASASASLIFHADTHHRNLFATLTHYPSTLVGEQGLLILKDLTQRKNLTCLNPQLITYSIPTAAIERSKIRGGNALGLGNVQGHLVVNLLALSWNNRALDQEAYDYADQFIADFRQAAEHAKVFHPFIYLNYANKGQDPFASYGKKNHQRLLKIQKDVDPGGVFTSEGLWSGFFKLS